MGLTDYGKDVILKMLFFTLFIDAIAFVVNIAIIKIILFLMSAILFLFTLYFFRDPKRKIPEGLIPGSIISPADGKVVLIEKIVNGVGNIFNEGENLIQVSVFLSPLNVHVNRIPLTGVVKYFKYIKGEYLVAFNHKASEKNERTEIGIENGEGKKILFKQIAGFIARRIVCEIGMGSEVYSGIRFGMIKFGSRVDMIFKQDAFIKVKLGQKVKAGITIIAEV